MAKAISIHSHKGGSGKTLVTMNLAAFLVKQGFRVAVIDMDLTAPSLQTYAPNRAEKTINNFLLDNAKPEEVFADATDLIPHNGNGKLFMALADVAGEEIARVNQRDQDALLNDLFLMMELVRNKLPSDPWNIDYIIIDTSPGLTTHAINGVAITDHVIMVLRLINADVDGSRHFLETLYNSVQPKVSVIVNQIADHILMGDGYNQISQLVTQQIINPISTDSIQLAGILSNDMDVISKEFNFAMQSLYQSGTVPRPIHVIDEACRVFAGKFSEVIQKVLGA